MKCGVAVESRRRSKLWVRAPAKIETSGLWWSSRTLGRPHMVRCVLRPFWGVGRPPGGRVSPGWWDQLPICSTATRHTTAVGCGFLLTCGLVSRDTTVATRQFDRSFTGNVSAVDKTAEAARTIRARRQFDGCDEHTGRRIQFVVLPSDNRRADRSDHLLFDVPP